MLSKKVKEFIHRHLPQSPRIIVGLSGGADSMALLLALKEAGCHILAAHCNFHLRGAESNRDQEHCESICRMLGVELATIDFDVTARRTETGESVEMACRSLRYDWWNGLIDSGIGEYIAVGHHCEDNVETLFLNLLRGSGIAGLKGMLPVNGRIVRPLLECTRAEIEDYVSGRGYRWVTDSTNSENEYKRNRLRNVIIPMLEQEFPGAMSSIVRSLGVLRENFSLYKALTDSRFSLYDSDGIIDMEGLIRCEPQPRAILHESLTSFGFTHSQIDDLYDCVTNEASDTTSGQMFITPKGRYIYERGKLSRQSETIDEEREVDLSEHPFSMSRMSISDFWDEVRNGMSNKNVIYFDSSVLEGNPKWSIRSWRQGDRLAPFGMKGSRLVSDLYTDAKYSSRQKHSVPLLFRDGVLVWVIGLRASRHFKVNDATTSVIKITFE